MNAGSGAAPGTLNLCGSAPGAGGPDAAAPPVALPAWLPACALLAPNVGTAAAVAAGAPGDFAGALPNTNTGAEGSVALVGAAAGAGGEGAGAAAPPTAGLADGAVPTEPARGAAAAPAAGEGSGLGAAPLAGCPGAAALLSVSAAARQTSPMPAGGGGMGAPAGAAPFLAPLRCATALLRIGDLRAAIGAAAAPAPPAETEPPNTNAALPAGRAGASVDTSGGMSGARRGPGPGGAGGSFLRGTQVDGRTAAGGAADPGPRLGGATGAQGSRGPLAAVLGDSLGLGFDAAVSARSGGLVTSFSGSLSADTKLVFPSVLMLLAGAMTPPDSPSRPGPSAAPAEPLAAARADPRGSAEEAPARTP